MMATAQHCPATLERLKRLVQQRTAALDAVRAAYVRDVLSVKLFLRQHVHRQHHQHVNQHQQQRDAREVTSMAVPLSVPEEINRAPSADLRRLYRDMMTVNVGHDTGVGVGADADADAHADAPLTIKTNLKMKTNKKIKMREREGGFLQTAGVAPSAGGVREIPRPRAPLNDATVRDADEEVEAKVQQLSLGVYAPSSHALVVKPCHECLGVATFIARRNQRVDEALATLDRTERLEEEVAALSATSAGLWDRLLPAEAKLEQEAERLKETQSSGSCGRDWLVKELARVVEDASAQQAEALRREEAVLEGHRRMDREKRKLKEEGEAAAATFRAQISEAKEEVESLREALLQSNADTRREATKAAELEKEAFSLGETVRHVEAGLRDRGRLLAAANLRAAEAEKEAVLLRERLRAARGEAAERELEAGSRLHEAELALEDEAGQTRHLTAKLDEANAKIASLHERVAGVTAAAEMDRKRAQESAEAQASAEAEAEAASAELAAAALVPRPSPSPSKSMPPVPKLAIPPIAAAGVDLRSTSTQTPPADENGTAGAPAAAPVDGGGGGGGGVGKVRLAARACELGVKRGLRQAAERSLEEAAAAEGVVESEEEEGEEEESVGAASASLLEGEGEGGVWRERARVAEARLEAAEVAINEREETMSRALAREVSRRRRAAEALAAVVDVDLGDLRSAVGTLGATLVVDKGDGSAAAAAAEGGELTASKGGGNGAGVRSGGGNIDSSDSSDGDSGGGDAARVRDAVKLLLSRLAEATGGVAALKAQLADAIKRTTLGRETREAERVRTAKLVNSLRSELDGLRKRPRTGEFGVQTVLRGADLRATEALVLELRRKHEDFEVGLEALREESDRRQELASLKAEEDALKAEDQLHASHVREGSAVAYCKRLEGRVSALMAHRDKLRQERQVLRAAVRASFRDTSAKEQQRMQMRRTVATQVKCSVCALHGELGAGQEPPAEPASAKTPATPTPATLCRTNGKGGAQTETELYTQAAAAAAAVAAATAASPRLRPGKAWRRRSEFPKRGVSGASGNGDGSRNGNRDGRGRAPGVIDGPAGGGDGDGGDGGGFGALPDSNRKNTSRREGGRSKTTSSLPRGRGWRDGVAGFNDGAPDHGDVGGGVRGDGDGVFVTGQRREGWAAWDRGGDGGDRQEEPPALPQHSSSSSSSSSSSLSSSTSGILARRGLRTGEMPAGSDCARRRRRNKLRWPASLAPALPLLAADGGIHDLRIHDLPLGAVAARVQQQRFGRVGEGIRENPRRRTAR